MSSRLRNRDRRGMCQCPETLLHSYLEFIRDCSGYRSIQCTNQGAPSWAFRIANANAHVWVCVRLSFQQSAELLSHRRQYRYKDDHLPPYRKTFVKKRECLVLRESCAGPCGPYPSGWSSRTGEKTELFGVATMICKIHFTLIDRFCFSHKYFKLVIRQ